MQTCLLQNYVTIQHSQLCLEGSIFFPEYKVLTLIPHWLPIHKQNIATCVFDKSWRHSYCMRNITHIFTVVHSILFPSMTKLLAQIQTAQWQIRFWVYFKLFIIVNGHSSSFLLCKQEAKKQIILPKVISIATCPHMKVVYLHVVTLDNSSCSKKNNIQVLYDYSTSCLKLCIYE